MGNRLTPLLQALDAAPASLHCFVRDDDAGWDDAALLALLDTTAQAGVAIDLAAIPQAVSPALAHELNARIDAAPALLGVHQHGFAHTNHETRQRSCEFGAARDRGAQMSDLLHGRARLQQHFGRRLQAWFTPPWNRCAPWTPGLLAELGYGALSRDRGAAPQQALPELPVDVDWCRHHREGGPDAVADALTRAAQARLLDGRPLGLMLHHARMDAAELALLGRWLHASARHPRCQWLPMAQALSLARLDGSAP